MRGNPQTMQKEATYQNVTKEVIVHLGQRLEQLREMGVCDVILDPGFGFAKTLDHNYELMAHLQAFKVLQAPLLVGVSRKSMVYRLLECTPQEALNGTTALHTIALLKGANILRVHDVKAAAEAISIVKETLKYDGGGIGTTK
jgi:dihydropteroate synthase